jgi:Raf kinase inhibitor-like YbhB/YbcL family protein
MTIRRAVLLALLATRAGAFELTSTAFAPDATIPVVHTCDGADRSPPLAWREPPANAQAFALVCEDPDAPAGTWVHWVLYGLPPTARTLPSGVAALEKLPDGSRQGTNDFRRIGWGGPCPPPGKAHRYVFRLQALDAPVDVPPGASRDALRRAVEGHVVGEATLTGRYGRQ